LRLFEMVGSITFAPHFRHENHPPRLVSLLASFWLFSTLIIGSSDAYGRYPHGAVDQDVELMSDAFPIPDGEIPILERILAYDAEAVNEPQDRQLSIRFPRLTGHDRELGANPGYPSYYNEEFKHIEDEIEEMIAPRQTVLRNDNPEVAEDPFETNPSGQIDSRQDASMDEPIDEGGSPSRISGDPILKKAASSAGMVGSQVTVASMDGDTSGIKDVYFTVIVAVSSAVAAFTIVVAGIVYHKLQRNAKAAEDVEYPAYGVTGPGKDVSPTGSGGDRKLAQNAQMYHYQHQKQQMIAFDSHQNGGNRNRLASDDESDDGEEGDYTVYECPGLAPTGEMEVRNPMFSDDPDQVTPKAAAQK